jgi:hypothetical protein
MPNLVISAKDLGEFAYPNPCPRCLWLKLQVRRLPWQSFPGIFSSIDLYTKAVVNAAFARDGTPPWLSTLGDIAEPVDPPPYTRFSVTDQKSGVTLRGQADAIFRMRDGSYTIVDFKTARYTPGQEAMMPQYHAQLNGYAFIGERLDFKPVSRLALVYMEPVTHNGASASPDVLQDRGFLMHLHAQVVDVPLKPDAMIPPLLAKARAVFAEQFPPDSKPDCKDCASLRLIQDALER